MPAPVRPPEETADKSGGSPDVVIERNEAEMDDDKKFEDNEEPLGRRWSAPVRTKPAEKGGYKRTLLKEEDSKSGGKLSHSYRDKRQQNTRAKHEHTDQIFRHKSITSLRPNSSSSASDSAFSQSRTTLETDSEATLNRFSGKKPAKERALAAENDSRLSSEDGGSSSGTSPCAEQDLHFEILWQNLTYTIPEKRLARLASYVSSKFSTKAATKSPSSPACSFKSGPDTAASLSSSVNDGARHLEDGLKSSELHQFDSHHPDQLNAPLSNRQRRTIFSNLNGCVKSGQLTAILGPSGAGKTTFLKCLTNSITKGVSGSISIHNVGAMGGSGTPPAAYKSSQHLKLCIIPQKGESSLQVSAPNQLE